MSSLRVSLTFAIGAAAALMAVHPANAASEAPQVSLATTVKRAPRVVRPAWSASLMSLGDFLSDSKKSYQLSELKLAFNLNSQVSLKGVVDHIRLLDPELSEYSDILDPEVGVEAKLPLNRALRGFSLITGGSFFVPASKAAKTTYRVGSAGLLGGATWSGGGWTVLQTNLARFYSHQPPQADEEGTAPAANSMYVYSTDQILEISKFFSLGVIWKNQARYFIDRFQDGTQSERLHLTTQGIFMWTPNIMTFAGVSSKTNAGQGVPAFTRESMTALFGLFATI